MAEFCKSCTAMFTLDGLERLYSTTGFTSHGTVEDMKNNAAKDCPLCTMFIDSDFAHPRWKRLESWDKERRHPYDYFLENNPDGVIRIIGRKDSGGKLMMLILNIGRRVGFADDKSDRPLDWAAFLALKVSVESTGGAPMANGLKSIRLDTELAIDQAKDWIKTCDSTHPNCRPTNELVPLPSRVLDISNGVNGLRLLVTDSMMGEYVALSYCWGFQQKGVTLQSNLLDHLEILPAESLAPTIKDAVKVTKALGLKYLWVDALCIIQDSFEDKIQEISKMNEYYKNASITIVASAAKSANDGFLSPADYRFCHTPIALTNENEATATITHPLVVEEENETARMRADWNMGKWKINNICRDLDTENAVELKAFEVKVNMAIESRGWTLQEKLLSPRKLRYGVTQFDWRCKSGHASFSILTPNLKGTITTNGTEEKDPPEFDFFGGPDYKPSTDTLLTSWWLIAGDYSDRSLGVLSDKLPAIGGIANEFHRVTGDLYIAGLWQSRILKDLTWRAGDEDDMEYFMKKPDRTRSPVYRAPSWSWASIDGRINMDQSVGDCIAVAEIKGHHIHLESGQNPFGGVKNAWLDIEGSFKILPSKGKEGLEFKERLPNDEESEAGFFSFDIRSDRKCTDSELGLLYLWRHSTTNFDADDEEAKEGRKMPDLAVGLMISRMVFYKEYRRVGMFYVDASFFDGVPRKRVRIV